MLAVRANKPRLAMKLRRIVRNLALVVAALLMVAGTLVGSSWLYLHPPITRTNGIVYGQRDGKDLPLDVLRPAHPNGLGVAVMVSGGWKSGAAGSFGAWMTAPLLREGYTVFAVYHISQPQSTVMEIVEDVSRGIRFIRHHAREYGIDPQRLGVTGGSAGGHLSLLLATRGGPGPTDAADPVDRESSAVQAVAIFFPVTDLLNLGRSTENPGDGGPPKSFVKAFGPQSTNLTVWKGIGHGLSPIYFVHSNLPPILIYHGDADTLVPLDQSERFLEQVSKTGCPIKLVVHPGGRHGWLTMLWDIRHFAAWFDRYLRSPPAVRA
jgi:acetyl esterase/lipase